MNDLSEPAHSGRSGDLKKNVLLSLAALCVALLFAEILVRIVDPIRPPDRVEFMVDRETYWRVIPNQADSRPPAVTVNAQGFRGVSDIGAKQSGRKRVLVLGDSYTWGMGVADDETYAEQLQDLSRGRLEVINGGTPGWGVFQFQVRLERWIERLQPDIVVVLVNTADILRQPYASEEAEQAFLRQSSLRNTVRRVSKLVTVTYRLIDRMKLQRDNRQVDNAVAMDQSNDVRPELYQSLLNRDIARLDEMFELALEHGAVPVLVAWPQRVPMTESFLAAMKNFAEVREISYLDLSETLRQHDFDTYTLPNDHHPSAFGNTLIAEELNRAITALE